MKTRLVTIALLLTACSTSTLDHSVSNELPSVESRTNKNGTGGTRDTNVTVNANPEPVVEVRKNNIPDRVDPNSLFQNSSVYFDLDEYTVKESFIPLLKQHAEFLIKNPNEFVFIQGHTDERGGTEYNLALGQRRANAVKMALSRLGVSDQQMEAFSYGSTKPRATGSTEEAWAENRRVDLEYRN
jgi:peptidoglycan-associated lipoprotein